MIENNHIGGFKSSLEDRAIFTSMCSNEWNDQEEGKNAQWMTRRR